MFRNTLAFDDVHDGDQKQVVRSMLDTLVEGQFHEDNNCTIRSETHINVLLFGLLPRLAPASSVRGPARRVLLP